MERLNREQRAELEAVEFTALTEFLARAARTRTSKAALSRMHPWDGFAGLRRLRQRELAPCWDREPQSLGIVPFDESLDEILNPAGWLLPEHWRQLMEGMKSLVRLLRVIAGLRWPEGEAGEPGTHLGIDLLQVTAGALPDPAPLAELLNRAFDADGELDPARIPSLAELHRERMRCLNRVQNRLQSLLRAHPEAFQEATIVERNGRSCLPVKPERKTLVPGLVLDRSSSGATVFLEPFEAVSLNNDFVEADRAFTEAVHAFLRDLLARLRAQRDDLERWHRFVSDVDETLALLHWQRLCDGTLPILGSEDLDLAEARHPLLLPQVRIALDLEILDHDVIPLNLSLAKSRPGLVISGSNTGGKTVVLKTVGLLLALSHAGCAIPSKAGTRVPALTSLHADIGDHQTLIGSLSTFSSHVLHLKHILSQAKRGGLVLLDELGTGTDPKEGAALGIAVLQALSRRDCWVLCSTHLGEISQWVLRHGKFQNASVQFDEDRLAPTYRLMVGLPGQSRALTIAAKLGLPAHILENAGRILGKREQDWREFLRELEADRLRVLEQAEALQQREVAMVKDQNILREREENLRLQQERFTRESSDKLRRTLDFIEHESKRLLKELKEKQKESAAQNADRLAMDARDRIKMMEQIAHAEMAPVLREQARKDASSEPLQEGRWARHRGLGIEGKIVRLSGDRATLQTPQGRTLEVRLGELDGTHRGDVEAPVRGGKVRVKPQSCDTESEINLIGRASDDIDMDVHRFVEAALASGHRFIRVVHGHGTGRLKAAVRDALKGHPSIVRVEDAPQTQGGSGATLITLR